MLFLGPLVMIAVILVFSLEYIRNQRAIVLGLRFACGLTTVYVFFIYQKLVSRANKFLKN